jgi:uncharacterized protein with von Willebrand factor type A (vWA) domain
MRARILGFVQALRAGGLEVSVAEAMDAVAAVSAAGVERAVLREALAATLVKDEAERPAFDVLFERAFPLVGPGGDGERRRRRARGGGGGAVPTGAGRGRGGGSPGAPRETPEESRRGREPRDRTETPRESDGVKASAVTHRRRAAETRRLLALPFREFTDQDVSEARALVRDLGNRLRGRMARRARAARRGRLDFRRTIRGSLSSGGVPVRPRWRSRRPGRPDLLALCDLSGSVAVASELLLGLLAPAGDYFRRVRLFAYVDHLCPVSVERGHVAPGAPLDLHARSDFGRVLAELWEATAASLTRATLVIVIGDARNNRLPPRADLLRALRERVRHLLWLVPEPRARWDTGDSVLASYAPACDGIVECLDLATLVGSVREVL